MTRKKDNLKFRDATNEERDKILGENCIKTEEGDCVFIFKASGHLAITLPRPSVMLTLLADSNPAAIIALSLVEMFKEGPEKVIEFLRPFGDRLIENKFEELFRGPGPDTVQ